MHYIQKHKEIIPIIAIIIAVGVASYDLFSDQQDNSELLNSGTTIDPVSLSGRAACEVPIPDVSKQQNTPSSAYEAKEITH